MDQPLKLTTELVTDSVWFGNLRKLVSKKAWDRIRKAVYVAQAQPESREAVES